MICAYIIGTLILGRTSKAMFGSGGGRLTQEKAENANRVYGDTGVYGKLLYTDLSLSLRPA